MLFMANKAIEKGDLSHPTVHIARALVAVPDNVHALTLLRRIRESSNDPLSLVRVQDQNYAGNMAVRAHLLAQIGHYQEAIKMPIARARGTARNFLDLGFETENYFRNTRVAGKSMQGLLRGSICYLVAISVQRHQCCQSVQCIAQREAIVRLTTSYVQF